MPAALDGQSYFEFFGRNVREMRTANSERDDDRQRDLNGARRRRRQSGRLPPLR